MNEQSQTASCCFYRWHLASLWVWSSQTHAASFVPSAVLDRDSFIHFWNISLCIQSGSGNTTAQKAVSWSHSCGKLSAGLTFHAPIQKHWEGILQTGHRVPVKEQSPRPKPVCVQKRSLHWNSPVVCDLKASKTARAAAQSSVLILFDLSATFDTVNHRILLSILSSIGISGRVHSWFESYLTGRSFNVSWQGQLSVPHHRGAPRLGVRTTSLCHIHHLVVPNHPLAWFFISLLCI